MKQKYLLDEQRELIEAARGVRKCDAVIRGGYVVSVFTGEIERADVGMYHGRIAAVVYNGEPVEAEHIIDADGLFLTPGLIDSHMHLESSMLSPAEFAKSVLSRGTTAVVIDPHEIANVAGVDGIRELLEASEGLPLTFYFMIPPAVPATDLDTSGGRIDAGDIAGFAGDPRVLGIAEAMDYPGVIEGRRDELEKIGAMPGKVVDGHAPGLSGRDLQAYAAAGITSEHEAINQWEGLEKLRAGFYLMIREGSAAHDLGALIKLVDTNTVSRCLLATDDLSSTDLLDKGHIDYLLSRAVKHGISAQQAIRMATLNTAQRFKLDGVGAVAPGYRADIACFKDLIDFQASLVVAGGEVVAMDGEVVVPVRSHRFSEKLTRTVHLPDLTPDDIIICAGSGLARVIGAQEGQLVTQRLLMAPAVLGGRVVPDVVNDVLKIVVVERYGRSGSVGLGLVKGFGLGAGAMAGSVSHDSHNVVAVGTSDRDIIAAAKRVGEMNGGLVVARDGEVVAELALPVGGLMSDQSAGVVAGKLRRVEQAARDLGCPMEHPFMTLSFMCLPVIPELKITDRGLVDVEEFEIVPLFAGDRGQTRDVAL